MNGKHHRFLLWITLLPFVLLLGYLHADIQLSFRFILLWLVGMKLSPDIDLKLPFIKHRGITHNPVIWFLVGIIGYYWVGWYVVSFPITQEIHIISDHLSTGTKRTVTRVKKVI